MTVVLLTILIMALLIVGMAIGLILNNKPLKGSCGGLNSLGMDTECDICGGDKTRCEKTVIEKSKTRKATFYDVFNP